MSDTFLDFERLSLIRIDFDRRNPSNYVVVGDSKGIHVYPVLIEFKNGEYTMNEEKCVKFSFCLTNDKVDVNMKSKDLVSYLKSAIEQKKQLIDIESFSNFIFSKKEDVISKYWKKGQFPLLINKEYQFVNETGKITSNDKLYGSFSGLKIGPIELVEDIKGITSRFIPSTNHTCGTFEIELLCCDTGKIPRTLNARYVSKNHNIVIDINEAKTLDVSDNEGFKTIRLFVDKEKVSLKRRDPDKMCKYPKDMQELDMSKKPINNRFSRRLSNISSKELKEVESSKSQLLSIDNRFRKILS